MQNNSENNSKASREVAAFHLQKIYEILDYDPWAGVWEKLSHQQKCGVCLVAGVREGDDIPYWDNWANFTQAECQKIQKAISTFCSISEQVRRAVGAANAVRGEVAA